MVQQSTTYEQLTTCKNNDTHSDVNRFAARGKLNGVMEARRRQGITAAWKRKREDRYLQVLRVLREVPGMAIATNAEWGQVLGLDEQTARKTIYACVKLGVVSSELRHGDGVTAPLTQRILRASDAIPEGEVGSKADAHPGSGPAEDHPVDPEDL